MLIINCGFIVSVISFVFAVHLENSIMAIICAALMGVLYSLKGGK